MAKEEFKKNIAELYELWGKNLELFVSDTLGHYLTAKMPEFHKDLYKLIPTRKRLLIAAPRGFAKSHICSVFYPLWNALFGRKKSILIISKSETFAKDLLRRIRLEIEGNQLIRYVFGDLKSDKWTEGHIVLNNKFKTEIRAKGAGGQIRGSRPDLVVLDDIETDESVASEEQRSKLRTWVFKACLNTLMPEGQFLWIGTIISPLALLQEMFETENGWYKKKYRAYIDADQRKGKELWAALWTHERLQQRKKEIGSFAFASEYLNDPILDEAAPIKQQQIRIWDKLPSQYNCVISVDPAYSDDEKADYKVASLVGIDVDHNRYLISYIRTHRPQGEFIDAILNLYLQNKSRITGIGIPSAGTEKEFFNSVVHKAQSRKLYPPFMELKNAFKTGTEKVVRHKKDRIVAALQPLFEAGKYYIHKDHSEAKDELLSIGASRWDDIVDTLAYAEQILTPTYVEPETPQRGRYGEYIENKPKVFDYGY